ncbi:MAG: DegT/DnrJ/EryC1/StrS family aminotransferase [Deltaproteobacteria bacterium]|nr:DegT/DnrJ/EryC1/StrS family aminotransferase [Deltaproteobacteria bacterium]
MNFSDYVSGLRGSSHLYANASNGWKDLLVALRQRSGSARANVVVPSYLPAKLYRASLAADCAVRFYEVRGACVVDPIKVATLIDSDTIAVLVIHYFGFPGPLDDVVRLTRERETVLVEDCALALGGTHDGQALGTFGDAALFSMRKMFNFSEGGLLRLGDALIDPDDDDDGPFAPGWVSRVSSFFSVRHFLRQRAKYAYVRLTGGADPLRLFRYDPPGYMDWDAPQSLSVKLLSRFSEQRLARQDVDAVVAARRRNYVFLAERFPEATGFEPLQRTLDDGVAPYSFPFLVDGGKRDGFRQRLLRGGVVAGAGWPESPFDHGERTRRLSASLLELPVHQSLTQAQLEGSLRAVEAIAVRRSK